MIVRVFPFVINDFSSKIIDSHSPYHVFYILIRHLEEELPLGG